MVNSWQVVTKPATAIVDEGAHAKPKSQLERAKNGRPGLDSGAEGWGRPWGKDGQANSCG